MAILVLDDPAVNGNLRLDDPTVFAAGGTLLSDPIPYLPETGAEYVDLVNPVTTAGSMLEGYTGDAPVTGDQLVFESQAGLTVDAQGYWNVNPPFTSTQISYRRVIQVDGTVGVQDNYTFQVGADGEGLVKSLVKDLVKPLVKNLIGG